MIVEPSQKREWPNLYAALVVLVGAAFLYVLLPSLSPVILFIALAIVLAPFAGTRYHRAFMAAAVFLVLVWLLRTLASLLAPFILAFVVAYILDPLADRLQARGLKRGLAVAVLMLPLIALMTLVVVFGIPALVNQAEDLILKVPSAVQKLLAWVESSRARLERIPWFRSSDGSRMLESFSPERFAAFLQQQQAEIIRRLWGAILGVGKGVGFALSLVGYLVLVPVLIIYLLLDFDGIKARALTIIPPRYQDRWLPLLVEYDALLARYFRGQVLAALIVGILTWLGLLIVGFPYSGLVGAIAGVFNLVPYLGLVVSAIPALLIALLSGNVLASLIKAAIVFGIVQLIDGTVTGPRIVGGSVGLHPVWVILALAIGSFFFGFAGLLLAMPAGVLLKLLLREALAHYKRSRLYTG